MTTVSNQSLIELALGIALDAHRGQKDKAGQPYIQHPLRLMQRMVTEEEQATALLHDVIEDSDYSTGDLINAGIPQHIVDAVSALSRQSGESYSDFIERLSTNPLAKRIKMADLEDNLKVLRLNALTERDLKRVAKYHKAWKTLAKDEC